MKHALVFASLVVMCAAGALAEPAAKPATEGTPAPEGSPAAPRLLNAAPGAVPLRSQADPRPLTSPAPSAPTSAAPPAAAETQAKPAKPAAPSIAAPSTASPSTPPAPSAPAEAAKPVAPAQPPTEAVIDDRPPPPPKPTLVVDVDLSSQRMTVIEDGDERFHWPISSARAGYRTPTGKYQPMWASKMHYSKQYDWAPMPNAIFFHRGVAIHGTYSTRQLGRPASHGCIRLSPGNAAHLYQLVHEHGFKKTRIVIHGSPPYRDYEVAERDPYGRRDFAYEYYYDGEDAYTDARARRRAQRQLRLERRRAARYYYGGGYYGGGGFYGGGGYYPW